VNCRRICFWCHQSVVFLFVYEISWGTAERICTKFTWKMCLVPCLQCFDTVGWAAGRASGPYKIWEDGGGGHWLVRMEWRPAGWSMCLPLLISPCTIKSRSSLLAPAHPGGPGKRAVKRLWCGGVWSLTQTSLKVKVKGQGHQGQKWHFWPFDGLHVV